MGRGYCLMVRGDQGVAFDWFDTCYIRRNPEIGRYRQRLFYFIEIRKEVAPK
jgi:hypothetical protein